MKCKSTYRSWEVEGRNGRGKGGRALSFPYKVRSKEILSTVAGTGNGGLIVFFEVEEETEKALRIVI